MHEWCVCVRASSSVCACVNHTCVSARRCRIWRVAGPKINRHTLCGLRGRAGRRGPIKRAADLSDVIWWWCAAWCAENESSRTALITRFIAFASNLCRARALTHPRIFCLCTFTPAADTLTHSAGALSFAHRALCECICLQTSVALFGAPQKQKRPTRIHCLAINLFDATWREPRPRLSFTLARRRTSKSSRLRSLNSNWGFSGRTIYTCSRGSKLGFFIR